VSAPFTKTVVVTTIGVDVEEGGVDDEWLGMLKLRKPPTRNEPCPSPPPF
jgi:hypothetical protein